MLIALWRRWIQRLLEVKRWAGEQWTLGQKSRSGWLHAIYRLLFTIRRRKRQPTPVFLPRESHGWRSLVGCSPWGRTESDTTEATWQQHLQLLQCWKCIKQFLNNMHRTLLVFEEETLNTEVRESIIFHCFYLYCLDFYKTMYCIMCIIIFI